MSTSNSWAEFAALFRDTRQAFLDHLAPKRGFIAAQPIEREIGKQRANSTAAPSDLIPPMAILPTWFCGGIWELGLSNSVRPNTARITL
jgi:hypothetical protein